MVKLGHLNDEYKINKGNKEVKCGGQQGVVSRHFKGFVWMARTIATLTFNFLKSVVIHNVSMQPQKNKRMRVTTDWRDNRTKYK